MFIKAEDAHRKSREVRDAREQKDLTNAILFLEEYGFNDKGSSRL